MSFDVLQDKIRLMKNPTVAGLAARIEYVPEHIRKAAYEQYGVGLKGAAEAIWQFNVGLIDALCDIVPAVKPQAAYYENLGWQGMEMLERTIQYAKSKGMFVIADIKRGDIGSTAEAYAGHIDGCDIEGEHFDLWKEDYITINPYLGVDGIEPFLKVLRKDEKGIFVLVRTSNPSSGELQDKMMEDTYMYNQVADLVSKWGEDTIGEYGYSKVGAVVGATHPAQGVELRKRMPHTFFLVPGYGAQGGKGADLKGFFDENGVGCIVNSSRGIIAAYKKDALIADVENVGPEFAEASRRAVIAMKEDLQNAF